MNIGGLSISATPINTRTVTARAKTTGTNIHATTSRAEQFILDKRCVQDNQEAKPVFTSTKATRCYRPKEWSPVVEEAFRVQQAGWKDLKEYMETYGEPERWDNGFIKCTRVKSNGYFTYWHVRRECDDKYIHSVKVYDYA